MSNYEEEIPESQLNMLGSMNRLQMVSFTQCTINKPSVQKFMLKNLSGIKPKFKFSAVNYEPLSHVAPQ